MEVGNIFKAKNMVVACAGVFLGGALPGSGYAANGKVTPTGKMTPLNFAANGTKTTASKKVTPLHFASKGRNAR